jgi:hypothetical protein
MIHRNRAVDETNRDFGPAGGQRHQAPKPDYVQAIACWRVDASQAT